MALLRESRATLEGVIERDTSGRGATTALAHHALGKLRLPWHYWVLYAVVYRAVRCVTSRITPSYGRSLALSNFKIYSGSRKSLQRYFNPL